jgi:hypothetical protein
MSSIGGLGSSPLDGLVGLGSSPLEGLVGVGQQPTSGFLPHDLIGLGLFEQLPSPQVMEDL